jgi:hypothetical protein
VEETRADGGVAMHNARFVHGDIRPCAIADADYANAALSQFCQVLVVCSASTLSPKW